MNKILEAPPPLEEIEIYYPILKKVEEEGVVVTDIVFLIYSDASFACWGIMGNGASIISINFKINKYATFFNIWGVIDEFYNVNPSVVKSEEKYQKHMFTIETISIDNKHFQPGYDLGYPLYGRRLQSNPNVSYPLDPPKQVVIGVRNCWIKIPGAEEAEFDFNTSYLLFPLGQMSQYFCSGRNSSYVNESKGLIRNLYLWALGGNEAQIKYEIYNEETLGWDTKDDGLIISYIYPFDIYATLSPNKIIGILDDVQEYIPFTVEQYLCDEEVPGGFNYDYTSYSGWKRSGWYFGDVQLEEGWHNYTHAHNDCWHCEPCPEFGFICRRSVTQDRGYRKIRFYDYDNINVDETFICFYGDYLDGRRAKGTEVNTTGWGIDFENWYGNEGITIEYKMVYRLKGGGLIKITLGEIMAGAWGASGGATCTNAPIHTNGSGTHGQRFSKFTCKVSEKYIVYSYLIHNYTGAQDGLDHIDDMNDTNYTFVKRVMGIIHIESGRRTEYEVNDSLLGRYKNTFNEEIVSAIGLHQLPVPISIS